LAGGRPVTIDHLVEKLWAAAAPSAARPTARTYVSRLRRLLPAEGARSVIQSGRAGYLLPVAPDALDLTTFDQLVRDSRDAKTSGDPGLAVRHLRQALALWQGSALAGARGEFVESERAHLEQLRLVATEERIGLDVDLGRHAEVLPEISSLAAAYPLEERLRELHMLALYRCARQADALQVYRNVRGLLHRELGIEPGPELRALHQRILRADPDLDRPDQRTDGADAAPPTTPVLAMAVSAEKKFGHGLLARRLHAARQRGFVGRDAERALFASALHGSTPTFATLFLHGPGGIGKSTLLRRLADDAEAAGRAVVRVDGSTVSSSPSAFARAAGAALTNSRAVLLVDAFERCAELEPWLREEFLPRLSDGAIVVVAGRQPPSSTWRADPSWSGALAVRALRGLTPSEATALLTARAVPAHIHDSVLAYAGGHPLALSLAADNVGHGDPAAGSWRPTHDLIETLLGELIGPVPSPIHQLALHVCAHAHSTTEDLLRAVMPTGDPAELFAWLRAQTFIESTPAGLRPQEIVRDLLDADLLWRDPTGYDAIHRGICRHVLDDLVVRHLDGPAALGKLRAIRHLARDGRASAGLGPGASVDATEAAGGQEIWLNRRRTEPAARPRAGSAYPVGFMSWIRRTEPDQEADDVAPVVPLSWESSPLRRSGQQALPGSTGPHRDRPAIEGAASASSPIHDLSDWGA
jgi:DNA-binding SARP family transcriptional activator